MEQLSSRFSLASGLSRVSLGLTDALSRLGISSGPAAAAVQDAKDVQAAAPLAAPTKATTSVSLGQDLKPLRRGLILTPELDHGAVLGASI